MKNLKKVVIAAIISAGIMVNGSEVDKELNHSTNYRAHAEYHTGQALANILVQNVIMTEKELTSFTSGLDTGLVEVEINEDLPIIQYTAQSFVDERKDSDSALDIDSRSKTTVQSDLIKAKLLGYLVGLSFSQEMGLNEMEAAKISLGFEDQASKTVAGVDIALNKSARKFIIERTANQYLTIPQLRVTQKMLQKLNTEISTKQS